MSATAHDCGHRCCEERTNPFHDHFLSSEDCPTCHIDPLASVDEARLHSTTDASVWAEEFAKVRPDVDQGLMLAWFANAIETGRAAAKP